MLERNLVVEFFVERRAAAAERSGPSKIAAALITPLTATSGAGAAARSTVEHGQLRVEALQHDLGRVGVGAVLLLPLARLELAFKINLGALLQILLGDTGEAFAEDDDAVPFGLLASLAARLVAPTLAGRHAQIDNGPPVLGVPHLRIGAKIADQNDLVYRPRHQAPL